MTPSGHICTHWWDVHTEHSASLTPYPSHRLLLSSSDHIQMCTPCFHPRIKAGGEAQDTKGGKGLMKMETDSGGSRGQKNIEGRRWLKKLPCVWFCCAYWHFFSEIAYTIHMLFLIEGFFYNWLRLCCHLANNSVIHTRKMNNLPKKKSKIKQRTATFHLDYNCFYFSLSKT